MSVQFQFTKMSLPEQKMFLRRVLTDAVKAGSLTKAREAYWRKRVEKDPTAATTAMPDLLKTAVMAAVGLQATTVVKTSGPNDAQPPKQRADDEAQIQAFNDAVGYLTDPKTGRPFHLRTLTAGEKADEAARKKTATLPTPSPTAQRDAVIDEALRDRKITEKDRKHYTAMFERDPISTRLLLHRLPARPGVQRPTTKNRTGLFPELDR